MKCDLREKSTDEEETEDNGQEQTKEGKELIDYKQGLEVARRIQALRYLGKTTRVCLGYPKLILDCDV